jgi:hypothetical protein
VLKAYVDKQRRAPQKMVEKSKDNGKVDIGALWTAPEGDKLEGGHYILDLPKKALIPAVAAPGISSAQYLLPATGKIQ